MDLSFTLVEQPANRFIDRLAREMQLAVKESCLSLKELMYETAVRLQAFDTFALVLSIYVSLWGFSEYDEAVHEASNAYAFNPTKWPGVRALTGGVLDVEEEVKPEDPDEGWVAVAASHGVAVEQGYVSIYGNDVPARPFVLHAAIEGWALVLKEFERALKRAAS